MSLKTSRTVLLAVAWFLLLSCVYLGLDFSASPRSVLADVPFYNRFAPQPKDFQNTFFMPLPSFLLGLAVKLPPAWSFVPLAAFCALSSLAVFAGGAALGGWTAGALASVAYSLFVASFPGFPDAGFFYMEGLSYAFSCSLVVCALALRSCVAARSYLYEALLALAIGIGFNVKSSLLFLPPLLAAFDVFSGKLRRGETSRGKLLVLCLLPYALLLPWTYLNYMIFNRFMLFEAGRADEGIIAGALGITYSVEGAVALPGYDPSLPLPMWALKTVLSNPAAYAAAVLRRFFSVYAWQPWISTAFLAAAWRWRRRTEMQALSLFAGYFVAMHCLLAVEPRYFFPLGAVFSVGAGVLFVRGLCPGYVQCRMEAPRIIFLALSGLALAAYLALGVGLFSYASRALAPAEALEKVRAEGSDDPGMLAFASLRLLREGTPSESYRLARKALLSELSPKTVKAFTYASLADDRALSGVFGQKLLRCRNCDSACLLLRSAELMSRGREEDARTCFDLAYQCWKGEQFKFRGIISASDLSAYRGQQRLLETDSFYRFMYSFLVLLPPDKARRYRTVVLSGTSEPPAQDLLLGQYLNAGFKLLSMPLKLRWQPVANNQLLGELARSTARRLAENAAPDFSGKDGIRSSPDTAWLSPYVLRSRKTLFADTARSLRLDHSSRCARELMSELLLAALSLPPQSREGPVGAVLPYLERWDVLRILYAVFKLGRREDGAFLAAAYLRIDRSRETRALFGQILGRNGLSMPPTAGRQAGASQRRQAPN